MPIPKPHGDESQDDYISRCMEWMDENESERPQKQQLAICFNTYRESKREGFVFSEPIPIVRAFEDEGKRYVYGYAAIFDSPDFFGTVVAKELVEDSLPRLRKFPAVRFMHKDPFAQIVFDEEVQGLRSFVDDHGFHVLAQVYDHCDEEWNMVSRGGWGFSYGLVPAPDGVKTKCFEDGKCYPTFVKGALYEISVVDAPAHPDAVAYVIKRLVNHGHKGGKLMTTEMQMSAEERERVPEKLGTGGYACKVGEEWKLPIHDEAHARNAMARYNQAEGCQTSEVKARICAAAKHFGVDAAFEKGGFCYQGEERKMEKSEVEQLLKDAEQRILTSVTKLIEGKKATDDLAVSLKAMEDRILQDVDKKFAELVPKKEKETDKTFSAVSKKLEEMDKQIEKLRGIEKSLREAGVDYKALGERIDQLERQREEISKTVVASVEKAIERKVGEFDQRLKAIENIPELKSPSTSSLKEPTVRRTFGGGFRGMLEECFREEG